MAVAGVTTVATAIGTVAIKALQSVGELEQNMGGSEAVFGKYAGKMQETAKGAYSSMGLSASDFLATANKMGALFQGAGFGIEESANLSADAMQRAADVASIMGIDTASAMEAVAGAAKGNFTMMDNLGVAMNETTLANYALEKGMKKSYNEMTQQEKIGVAMEMFLEKTAYAAGNYAKENETLAGSLGTAKAAISNFLSGAGTADDVINAVSNAANVVVKNLTTVFPKLMTGLVTIANQLVAKIPSLLQQLLPPLLDGTVSLINGLVDALPSVLDVLINSALPALLSSIFTIFETLVSALPSITEMISAALPGLIPQLASGIVSAIVTLLTYLPQVIKPIISAIPLINEALVQAIKDNLPILISAFVTLILAILELLPSFLASIQDITLTLLMGLVEAIVGALPEIISGIAMLVGGIIKFVIEGFKSGWQQFTDLCSRSLEHVKTLITGIWNGIKEGVKRILNMLGIDIGKVWESIKSGVSKAWNAIKDAISKAWDGIKSAVSAACNFIKNFITDSWNEAKKNVTTALNAIKNFVSSVWNAIKSAVSTACTFIKNYITNSWKEAKNNVATALNAIKNVATTVWNAIKNGISTIVNGIKSTITTVFNAIKNAISTVWNAIKTTTLTAWNNIKSSVSRVVNGVKSTISNVFNGIKSTATRIWNGIKTAITKPVESARDKIKSIIDRIKGFFSGMKLSFPKIKMPHFKISPSGWKIGDLLQGDIPKLGIEWYAKAMNNPMVMTKPTIFGYNAATGQLQGAGDAGSEVVSGTNTLMAMIGSAVADQNGVVVYYLQRMLEMLAEYFPQVIEAAGHDIVAQDGTVVAHYAPLFNREFARIAAREERGR